MSLGNSITILTVGIFLLAFSRLAGLFWLPVMVPASTDVPTAWQSFRANTRAKFMLGILLLGIAYTAAQVLNSSKGLQAFALILILLSCGIGGAISIVRAVWQHRYYAMLSLEIEQRSRAMTFDTLALAALLLMALLLSLAGPEIPPSALATSLYQTAIYLSIGLAVSIGLRFEPPSIPVQVEPQINWRNGAFMLAWLSSSMFKEKWLETLSPILGRDSPTNQIISTAEAGLFQQQLICLSLSGFLILLALPFLQRKLQIIRNKPFFSSVLLGMMPVTFVAGVSFDRTETTVPAYAIMAVAAVSAVIGQLLWYFCQSFVSWLQVHRTNREIATYPFHYLSVVGLIVLSWIGIFEADGIDRYFFLIAQCAALSSWNIRRLA